MSDLLLFAGIFAVAAVSPGPDFLIVLRNSIKYSRQTAFWTILGVAIGIAFHVSYILLGIGLVISQSIVLFSIIKFAGAAYLIYLGIKLFLTKKEKAQLVDAKISVEPIISRLAAVKMGFLCNVLNPKASLFFLAVFTQFINPTTPLLFKIGYGLEMIIISSACFALVAVFMTQKPIQKVYAKAKRHIDRFFGVVLIGLGVKVALTNR